MIINTYRVKNKELISHLIPSPAQTAISQLLPCRAGFKPGCFQLQAENYLLYLITPQSGVEICGEKLRIYI